MRHRIDNSRTETQCERERLIAQALAQQAQIELRRSPLVRRALIAIGFIALGSGVVGVVLPLLPTTPFVLLAAACFAHSSPRFFRWLVTHRLFGHHVARWRVERCIPARVKLLAIGLIALTIGFAALFVVEQLHARIALAAIGVAISTYLLRVPTCR